MSVHVPNSASYWLTNSDEDIITTIHGSDYEGPIPYMLSPYIDAFALFGPRKEFAFLKAAKTLANVSGFPVVIFPWEAKPTLFSEYVLFVLISL